MPDLEFLTITELSKKLRVNEVSSLEVTDLMLRRMTSFDNLNAFVTVTPELALEQAEAADRELAQGRDRGPLHGVPIAIKDLFETAGIRTTGGSRFFEDWVPEQDAAAVIRLKEAGAVILGKTSMHELAWGSTSINPFFGAVSNPWMPDHHPGGSSGGSAAAVAAGLAYAALGSDTGCSIRQPAQCCGLVGYKPTFGLVSKYGAIPLAWSMDHVGPLTRSVADAATMMEILAGYDEADPYSINRPSEDFSKHLGNPVAGRVIGVPRKFFYEGGDTEVVRIVESAIGVFEALGARLQDVDVEDIDMAHDAASAMFAESVAAHGDAWRERPDAFSESIHSNMDHYMQRPPGEYVQAMNFRQSFRRQVDSLMQRCDVLVTPTSTVAAAPIAEQPPEHRKERWKNTGIFNLTGQPSISVPCGFTAAGLPVGLMITGALFEDARVLQFAGAFEQATGWHLRHPHLGPL